MFIQSAIVTKWGDLFGNKKVTDIKNKKNFRVIICWYLILLMVKFRNLFQVNILLLDLLEIIL